MSISNATSQQSKGSTEVPPHAADERCDLETTTSAAASGPTALFQRVGVPGDAKRAALACCESRQPHAEICDMRNSNARRSPFGTLGPSPQRAIRHPELGNARRFCPVSHATEYSPVSLCTTRLTLFSLSRPLVSDSPSAASAPASLVAVRANLRKYEPCCSASRAARTTSIFEVSRACARCPTSPAEAR